MQALWHRLQGYTTVGVSTFLLDLSLVFTLRHFGVPEYAAISIGFLIAVSINFFFSYRYVFRGTERKPGSGYLFFILIAGIGVTIIPIGTIFLEQLLGINLLIARSLMGGFTGGMNFLLNNFVNFKMGLRSN